MFKILFQLLIYTGNYIINGFNLIYNVIKNFHVVFICTILTIIASIKGVINLTVWLLMTALNLFTYLVLGANNDFTSIISNPIILKSFRLANYIFPLQEAFSFIVTLSVTALIMLCYRFIKSWIPTVS